MMRFGLYALMTFALLATPCLAQAQADDAESTDAHGLWERDQLTDGWLDILDQVREKGFSSALTVTALYQQNTRGGLSTHRKAGRYSGVAELELQLDFDKLGWIPGGRTYALAAGSWSGGINEPSVGSLMNANGLAGGYRSIDLLELWYEQRLLDGYVRIRAGKIDMTGGTGGFDGVPNLWFDANAYANDPGMQFLNGGLVNNPQIPFPQQGLGAIAYIAPVKELVYVLLGVADAQADRRTTGFTSAFARDTRVMAMAEVGLTPWVDSPNGKMPGGYRVGVWYDPQPKERFNGQGVKRNDVGLYANADQMIFKENDDEDDSQGLGIFGRYGLADGDVNAIRQFWSVGVQYQGLIPTRDNDVLGVGIANGHLSGDADFRRSRETAVELYYNIQFAPWLMLTPSVQHITHPGGAAKDATVVGLRLQVVF
jgi:porin